MTSPATTWDMVRVFGTWHGMDASLLAGKYTVTLPRVTDTTDNVIIPAGMFAKDVPLVTTGSGPSLDFLCPATDDPDIAETGWKVTITVTFTGGAKAENYVIDVPYANRPVAAGGNGLGVNLRTIALAQSLPTQQALYKVGVPGGLAQLDQNGQVIDANGDPVTGSGTSGPIASTDITDATTVGKAVLTAVDQPTALSAIGAAPAAQGILANSAVQPSDLATVATTGAYGDIIGRPTTAADLGAVPTTRTVAGHALSADVAIAYSDLTGTVPTSALPPLAINETFTAASQTAMLALTAQRGDMAIRSDTGKTYVLSSDSPTTLADWKEVLAAGQVQSVAGKTGVVSLAKADVGLGSVDNTADTAKPVSTAQQTALNLKVNTSSVGAASGVASLDASAHLPVAQLAPGASIHVVSTDGGTTWTDLAGTTISARPTSRTDVRVVFETSGSTLPAWAITGDLLFKIGT